MKSEEKKKVIIVCVSLLIVIISALVFCTSLFFNNDNKKASIVFSYNNNSELIISNTSPITDELGKNIDFKSNEDKIVYSEFSISSDMVGYDKIDYEIYAKEINTSNAISSNYIKVYLTEANTDRALINANSKRVKTFDELLNSSSDEDAKRLYKGTLEKGEVEDFKFRMWLADTYTVSNELKNFEINLYVKVID